MNKKDQKILQSDHDYLWHPYTQMKDYETRSPLLIKRARGMKLYDSSGKAYWDMISSWWCNILGHHIPAVNRAIKRQIRKFDHVLLAGLTHQPAAELASELVRITHKDLTKVFYSDNGSTAVEVALKMSWQFRKNKGQKNKEIFLYMDYGYHGDTVGAMSVSGVSQFNNIFKRLFFRAESFTAPYCYRCPVGKLYPSCSFACLNKLKKKLKLHHKKITAVILEPLINGAGGMIVHPKGYLNALADILKPYDIHLILDEIAVGFGRTGTLFAYEQTRLKPDFLCLSKALTNGTLPLAVTMTTKKISSAFFDDYLKERTFFHGHTFTGNAIACSAALAALKFIQKKDIIRKSRKAIETLSQELKMIPDHPAFEIIGDIRQCGLVAALEIVSNKKTKAPFPAKLRFEWNIFLRGLEKGLIMRPIGNVFYVFLPLTAKPQEIKKIIRLMLQNLSHSMEALL